LWPLLMLVLLLLTPRVLRSLWQDLSAAACLQVDACWDTLLGSPCTRPSLLLLLCFSRRGCTCWCCPMV
jgi:hypothetical protein